MGQDVAQVVLFIMAIGYVLLTAVFTYVFYKLVPEKYPKTRFAVFLIPSCVAVALPFLIDKNYADSEKLKNSIVNLALAGCRANPKPINSRLIVNSLHIDRPFLNLLLYRQDQPATYEKIVRFMLENRIESLETQYAKDLFPKGAKWKAGSDEKFMQFGIKKSGDDECIVFDEWILKSSEAVYASLRKSGLSSDTCVGVNFSPTMKSDFAIVVDSKNVKFTDYLPLNTGLSKIDTDIQFSLEHRFGNWERYTVSFLQSNKPSQNLASFSEDFSFGGGGNAGYSFATPCGRDGQERALAFFKSLRVASDPVSLFKGNTVLISDGMIPETDDYVLENLKWIKRVDQNWNDSNISDDRLIWIESPQDTSAFPPAARYTRYTLNASSDQKTVVVPLYVNEYPVGDLTGLAVSDGKIATVVFGPGDRRRGQRYLLIFDTKKNAATLSVLKDKQYATLLK